MEIVEQITEIITTLGIIGGFVATGMASYRNATKNTRKLDILAEKIEERDRQMRSIKRGTLRLELYMAIINEPENKTLIMQLAEAYFKKQSGNWAMTNTFNKWREQNENAENLPTAEELKRACEKIIKERS